MTILLNTLCIGLILLVFFSPLEVSTQWQICPCCHDQEDDCHFCNGNGAVPLARVQEWFKQDAENQGKLTYREADRE